MPSVIVDDHREQARSYRVLRSTNRPSVSSPALDLDPPAPFGRLSAGVHPGTGAQRRAAKPHTLHVGAAKQTAGQCPRMNAAAKVPRALARGRTLGASLLVPFWRLKKGLAVRAKPPAAVTATTDMYSISQSLVGYQAAFASKPAPTGDSGTSARDWSTVRPSSPAGWLPQEILPQWIE
jgi:hypothetical protein